MTTLHIDTEAAGNTPPAADLVYPAAFSQGQSTGESRSFPADAAARGAFSVSEQEIRAYPHGLDAMLAGGRSGVEALRLVLSSLEDDKAQDIVVIDLAGKTSIGDFMVIASGTSSRQVGAMAQHLEERLKQAKTPPLAMEGMPQGDWVLLDASDVIVHLFRPEVRAFYNLEKMWGAGLSSPDTEQAGGAPAPAHGHGG